MGFVLIFDVVFLLQIFGKSMVHISVQVLLLVPVLLPVRYRSLVLLVSVLVPVRYRSLVLFVPVLLLLCCSCFLCVFCFIVYKFGLFSFCNLRRLALFQLGIFLLEFFYSIFFMPVLMLVRWFRQRISNRPFANNLYFSQTNKVAF